MALRFPPQSKIVFRAGALCRWVSGGLALGLALLFGSTALAQDGGTVSGIVVSSWDGAPLLGATVTVRGTTLATQTDASGRFELKNVPPGDQVLRFSKSSYASAVVTDTRVLPGQTTTVNGNLRPEFHEMEEYEVAAEEFAEQTEQIMVERQQSSSLLEAIGSEQFSKLGAGDAAEALSKVSGASIADGKFAVIRGLADRYTTTTLNGNDLPSADPDRKAAQLDLLPTQVIERMDVSKTFSPDMSGGFAGGSINIITRSYPDKFLFNLGVGTSYNTQASLNKNFLASDQSSTDWRGVDDGKRALPEEAANTNPRGTSAPLPASIKSSFGSTQFSPLPKDSPLNSGFSLALGDSFKLGEVRLGYLASLSYKNDYRFYDNGVVRKYDSGNAPPVIDKSDSKGVVEYTWAASTALTFGLGENHELKFNFLYVQSAEDEARRLQGQEQDVSTPGESYVDQSILHWTQRNLTYFQLAGNHIFPEADNLMFDWAAATSTATQEEPDYRIFQFLATPAAPDFTPSSRAQPTNPTRYWRELEEDNLSVRGDFTVPLPSYNSKDNLIKTGGSFTDSERDYFQRGFDIRPTSRQHPFFTTGDPQSYLDPTNSQYINYYNFPANVTYQGSQTIYAGYAMADWSALDWLRLVGGARLEKTDLTLNGFNQTLGQPLQPGGIKQDDLLPSLATTISLRENLLLRAAWSQTVIRPAYREIAPVAIYDVAQSRQYLGNPDLIFSDSANYDLRLEWFPRAGEVVSLSLFMKQITAPIEQGAEDVNSDIVKYFNYEKADVMGVEAEFRTRLDNFWEPLQEFTLGFNAAYIQSEVPLTSDQIANRAFYGGTDTSRPLYDQPEYILNADLTWEHTPTGTSITLSGGVVGPRLIVVGLARPDEYEEPAPQLDLFISQQLGKHWKLKFSAKNLLDPVYEVSQNWPTGGKVVIKSYTKGMTFGMSLGYSF